MLNKGDIFIQGAGEMAQYVKHLSSIPKTYVKVEGEDSTKLVPDLLPMLWHMHAPSRHARTHHKKIMICNIVI